MPPSCADASGCSVSGSTTVTLQTTSVWGVQGDHKPYTYQIIGLNKTSADGLTYTGSASGSFGLDPGESESWTWSMTGTMS